MFQRASQRYSRTPEPETPYQKAADEWDQRLGTYRVQAQNWRYVAFGALGLAGLLAGGVIWQSTQSRIVPYVVEVDRLGAPRSVAPAHAGYQPRDAEIAWHLGNFIRNVRSLSTDKVVLDTNWRSAFAIVTDQAHTFLTEYARDNDPFSRVGQKAISAQVTSVVRVSESTFQVKWTEEIYEQGSLASREDWLAMITTSHKSPSSAEEIERNPLGLVVKSLAWSREINSTAVR